MKLNTFNQVLVALYLFGQMPNGSGGVGLSELAYWSGISRSTVHRYIKMMIEGKLVKEKSNRRNKRGGFLYVITARGIKHWKDMDDIPF